jgi:hypothetical protein
MLFVEWWFIGRICLGLLIIALPVFSFWAVRNMRRPVRIPVQILSALIALCGVFPWLIVFALPWPHSYSAAVYSPNRKTAARIDDYNTSGFGGADTSVELFTFHGLKQDIVYVGDFETVGVNELRWKNDSELEIYYDGPSCDCKGTQRVLVRCIPKSSIKSRQTP